MRILGILGFSDIPVIIGYLSKHFIDFLVPYGNPFLGFYTKLLNCYSRGLPSVDLLKQRISTQIFDRTTYLHQVQSCGLTSFCHLIIGVFLDLRRFVI